ncbi:hypothetical protein [Paenibacillus terrigena]|nr:hypothetical protein [Paenibacillus terrigena]
MIRFQQEQWKAQILLSQGENIDYALYQYRTNEGDAEKAQV